MSLNVFKLCAIEEVATAIKAIDMILIFKCFMIISYLIIFKVIKDSYVVALAIDGKKMTSEGFADFMSDAMVRGVSHITFVIGGSLGLSDKILKRADLKLSFSDMTFPHQLMRVILLEQIYRANRIMKNEPYHK